MDINRPGLCVYNCHNYGNIFRRMLHFKFINYSM